MSRTSYFHLLFATLTLSGLFMLGGTSCSAQSGDGRLAPAAVTTLDSITYAPMKASFRGYPGDTSAALAVLRKELAALFNAPSLKGVLTSAKFVQFDADGSPLTIYEKNADMPVLPASVEKLFTSSTTMWALGSHYAFSTKLDVPLSVQDNTAVINGDVYLRPNGDPTFSSNDFNVIAQQLRQRGITEIRGDIISDLSSELELTDAAKKSLGLDKEPVGALRTTDSLLDLPATAGMEETHENEPAEADASEGEQQEDEGEIADVGVLSRNPNFSLDRNVVTITITGGTAKGTPLSVRVNPPIASIRVVNKGSSSAPVVLTKRRVTTGKGKKKRTRTVYSRSKSVTTVQVKSSGASSDLEQLITITGQLPARTSRTYSFPIKNVPLAMAAALKLRLEQNGIRVTGQPKTGTFPANQQSKTLAAKETPLMDLLTPMNKRSDNFLAETMFRKLSTITSVAANAPDERARKLMKSFLQVCDIDSTQCTFIDGSGLSKENRTSANAVIDLLTSIRQQPKFFDMFARTLSVAGQDGTLRGRMKNTPAQFNVHGKTGTLNGVTALAGYVRTGDDQLVGFFMTMQKFRNGPWIHKNTQDSALAKIANFRYSDYEGIATGAVTGSLTPAQDSGK